MRSPMRRLCRPLTVLLALIALQICALTVNSCKAKPTADAPAVSEPPSVGEPADEPVGEQPAKAG